MPQTVAPQNFPPEITHEFLKWFILFDETKWTNIRAKRAKACKVCRGWRNVVLANAVYWSTISMQLYMKPAYAVFCIDHARTGPIKLEMDLNRRPYNRAGFYFEQRSMTLSRFLSSTLPALRQAYSRVRTLYIQSDNEQDVVAVMSVLGRYDGVALRSATFMTDKGSERKGAFTTEVESTPVLTSMLLRLMRPLAFGVGIYKTVTSLTVACVNSGAGVTKAELAIVFQACVALETLQLDDVTFPGSYDGPPVVLPLMKRLRLVYEAEDSEAFVAMFRFPGLQELSLALGEGVSIQPIISAAPSLFGLAKFVSLRCDTATLSCLLDVVLAAVKAQTLDARSSCFVHERWDTLPDCSLAFQRTSLKTIRLPADVPFNMLRLMGDAIASECSGMGLRLVTEGMIELGEPDDCEWDFRGGVMKELEVAMDGGGEWMSPWDASVTGAIK